MQLLKTVFHIHTDYSDDSDNTIEHLLDDAIHQSVRVLAVTDHETIEGALALADAAPPDLQVIVGQEISTKAGHLVGLFLRETVTPGRSVRATAKEIRAQGGLIVVPHPFNTIFGCGLRDATGDIIDYIDIVEISNAQNLLPFPNRRAADFAAIHHFPALVGSDTHLRNSLCPCYQLIPPFDGPASFLDSVRQALLVPGRHSLNYFARSADIVLRSRLGLPLPRALGRNCKGPRTAHAMQPAAVPVQQ